MRINSETIIQFYLMLPIILDNKLCKNYSISMVGQIKVMRIVFVCLNTIHGCKKYMYIK